MDSMIGDKKSHLIGKVTYICFLCLRRKRKKKICRIIIWPFAWSFKIHVLLLLPHCFWYLPWYLIYCKYMPIISHSKTNCLNLTHAFSNGNKLSIYMCLWTCLKYINFRLFLRDNWVLSEFFAYIDGKQWIH